MARLEAPIWKRMKRLILFRHGKTERHALSGEDFDRRLTVRGTEDAHLMGKALAEAGFSPDLVLVSAAARAQETWGSAKAAFPNVAFEVRPELYNSDPRDLMRIARKAQGEAVMIVAHNPGLQALAASLAEAAADERLTGTVSEGFPTGAMAVFDFDGEAVTARGVFFPRDHGGGSDHD
jgi:phosphohistidine phosphatase